MDTSSLTNRLMRVLRFDASVYREVATDTNAFQGAIVIVAVAALLANLNALIQVSIVAYIIYAILTVVGFFVYAAAAAEVAKRFFQGKTDFNEMARTLGYTYMWYALGILALVAAPLTWIGSIVAWIAGVIALRESAEFDTVKAVVTVIVAGIIAFVLQFLLGLVLGLIGLGALLRPG